MMWEDLAKVKCTSAASSFDLADKQIDLNENKSERLDGVWAPLIFIGFQGKFWVEEKGPICFCPFPSDSDQTRNCCPPIVLFQIDIVECCPSSDV